MPTPLISTLLAISVTAGTGSGPPAHADWEPVLELSDEFKGDALDTEKWHDHNPGWKGREPGLFSPDNVSVGDGMLRLVAREEIVQDAPEGYHSFTTAAVKSRSRGLYGYFEIKCKPMRSRASSAFWFYDHTPEIWTEIDVFEIGGAAPGLERAYHMNAHVFHTPEYQGTVEDHLTFPKVWNAPIDLADEFRMYALEWDKEAIKWYVDGQLIRTLENTHWHQPLYMNMDSETMPDWFGLPEADELPAVFKVEYVRSWQRRDCEDSKIIPDADPSKRAAPPEEQEAP